MNINDDIAKEWLVERDKTKPSTPTITPSTMPDKPSEVEELSKKLNKTEIVEKPGSTIGYHPIPMSELPTGGLFYPTAASIEIRSATVEEIRHWSTMDESDMIDIDDKIDYIIDKCVRFKYNNTIVSTKNFIQLDRFYILFAVRELTFAKHENNLNLTLECTACNHTNNIIMEKEYIKKIIIPEKIMKYYDSEQLCFVLRNKTTDRHYLNFYIPRIGVGTALKLYAKNKRESGKQYTDREKTFFSIAPFLFDDWTKINNESIQEKIKECDAWDIEQLSAINAAIQLLNSIDMLNITYPCKACGHEEPVPLSFLLENGYKSLFLISDIL